MLPKSSAVSSQDGVPVTGFNILETTKYHTKEMKQFSSIQYDEELVQYELEKKWSMIALEYCMCRISMPAGEWGPTHGSAVSLSRADETDGPGKPQQPP